MATSSRLRLELRGTPDEIMARVGELMPEAVQIASRANEVVEWCKRQIDPYQAAVLALLAAELDGPTAEFLEIGTARGYSAAVLAMAAPRSRIVTLNPKAAEFDLAIHALLQFENVVPYMMCSRDYLDLYEGPGLDLVFVDGSHTLENVRLDCGWWKHLRPGGLILFHDYSPEGARRPTPAVYEAVTEFGRSLGRGPDVLVVDCHGTGMAGWYR